MRFIGADAEVMELHLRLGPRERHRSLKGGRIVMLVHQIECLDASRCNHRPERDVYRGTRRYSHAAAKTKDWIEYGADCIGERLAVDYRDRRAYDASAPKETCAIRLGELAVARRLTFDHREMRSPDLGIGGRARPSRGQ